MTETSDKVKIKSLQKLIEYLKYELHNARYKVRQQEEELEETYIKIKYARVTAAICMAIILVIITAKIISWVV